MKLVELLARELDVWPEGVVYICQDGEPEGRRIIGFNVKPDGGSYWSSPRGRVWDMSSADKSSDYKTAIITRADWQAERERIAGGWIAHDGGECPLDKGVSLDYMMRDGVENTDSSWVTADMLRWDHRGTSGDIIAYRLHKPEQQEQEEMTPAHTEYNPIHTRNRILEIDRTTEALEEERVQLVQRLADEGFSLLQVVAKSEPAEDMSDWRNWREGDLLMVVSAGQSDPFIAGDIVELVEAKVDKSLAYVKSESESGWNMTMDEVKFHSRPTA